VAREVGYEFRLLDEIATINEEQKARFLRKVRGALWTLKGKKLGVLGISFKGGTDDIRESPAIPIIKALVQEGCRLNIYDPAAEERAQDELGQLGAITFASSPLEAARGADAAVILTDWAEFAELDLCAMREVLKYHLLIDGRNLFDPAEVAAKGLGYVSIGRPDSFPENHPATMNEPAQRIRIAGVNL
jgi:UDPglucose 6-dehydrogenase